MRYLLTAVLLLLAFNLPAEAQSHVRVSKTYKVLEGTLGQEEKGQLLKVFSYTERDTLTLYLQHRERDTPLNFPLYRDADIAFYCFPETMGSEKYALRDAGGKVYIVYYPKTGVLVLFDDGRDE